MVMTVRRKASAILALAAGLCVAAAYPAWSQGGPDNPPPPARGEEGRGFPPPPPLEEDRAAPPRGFRFDEDDRGNIEGKRAACEVYARIAHVQTDANRRYRCGYEGPRWDPDLVQHFRWCRHVRRETVGLEVRERAMELQRCFDRLGDFDEEAWEHRR